MRLRGVATASERMNLIIGNCLWHFSVDDNRVLPTTTGDSGTQVTETFSR